MAIGRVEFMKDINAWQFRRQRLPLAARAAMGRHDDLAGVDCVVTLGFTLRVRGLRGFGFVEHQRQLIARQTLAAGAILLMPRQPDLFQQLLDELRLLFELRMQCGQLSVLCQQQRLQSFDVVGQAALCVVQALHSIRSALFDHL